MVAHYRTPLTLSGSVTIAASTTRYMPLCSTRADWAMTTEVGFVCQTAGFLKNLRFYLSANGATARVLTVRVNGADTALTVTAGASTTGWFENTADTIEVAAGDILSVSLATGSANSMTIENTVCDFMAQAATNLLGCYISSGGTMNSDRYGRLCGFGAIGGTSDFTTRQTLPIDCTFKNLFTVVATNSGSNDTNVYLRKNATNTALTHVVTTAVDTFADTINTVAFTAGDDGQVFYDESGVSNFTFNLFGMETYTSSGSVPILAGQIGGTMGGAATRYVSPAGNANNETTEADAEIVMRGSGTIRNLYTYITTNTVTVNCVVTIRKNGADTAVTFTIGASGTGAFSDTTHSFTYADGDTICISMVTSGGSGSLTFPWFSWELDPDSEDISLGGGIVIPVFMHQYRQRSA